MIMDTDTGAGMDTGHCVLVTGSVGWNNFKIFYNISYIHKYVRYQNIKTCYANNVLCNGEWVTEAKESNYKA